MTTKALLLRGSILGALCLAGCPTETPADAGRDVGPGVDAPVPPGTDAGPTTGPTCLTYCTQLTTNCSGVNAQYENMADCMDYCGSAGWTVGAETDTAGNTLGCRIYHGGVPAASNAAEHCPHAGPGGAGVCGTTDFRTESTGYSRVDRMGMPAVATALVSAGMKNAYNDGNPNDAEGGDNSVPDGSMFPRWAPEFATSLVGIHSALNDDLMTAGLTQCGTFAPTMVGDVLPCALQRVGGTTGPTVLSLVVPDTLQIDTTVASGFPNGRRLQDPVIDVTLAIILLDMSVSGQSAASFVNLDDPDGAGPMRPRGLNPARNDLTEGEFLPTFPYLHEPHPVP